MTIVESFSNTIIENRHLKGQNFLKKKKKTKKDYLTAEHPKVIELDKRLHNKNRVQGTVKTKHDRCNLPTQAGTE